MYMSRNAQWIWCEYADMAQEDAGYEFVPLAVESYGRLGGAASSFLSSLGDIAAADGRVSKAAFMRSARAELSCQLCRGNGRMIYASTFVIVRARGRTFTPGSPVPVADAGYV
jgi:hypothetical protein